MQAVLVLIFCASLGLAAWVTHDRRTHPMTKLAGARYVDLIGIRLPSGWILERENQGAVVFLAREPDSAQKKGRRLIVRKYRVNPAFSAETFLDQSGLLDGWDRMSIDGVTDRGVPISVGGSQGVMLAMVRETSLLGFTTRRAELVAAGVWPGGLALTLQMECPDETDPQGDAQTLQDIAGAMDVHEPAGR